MVTGKGFTVNHGGLAARVGEIKALADAVENVASGLACSGNLGPGNINAAVRDVAQDWVDGIHKVRDKANDMADHIHDAIDNYDALEQQGQENMTTLARSLVATDQVDQLRRAAALLLAKEHGLADAIDEKAPKKP